MMVVERPRKEEESDNDLVWRDLPVDRALSAPIPKQIIILDRHETQAARYYVLLLSVVAFYLELNRIQSTREGFVLRECPLMKFIL